MKNDNVKLIRLETSPGMKERREGRDIQPSRGHGAVSSIPGFILFFLERKGERNIDVREKASTGCFLYPFRPGMYIPELGPNP